MGRIDEFATRRRMSERVFTPKVVGVCGASARAGSMGLRCVTHLQEAGFEGTIVPVNPRYDEVAGVACHPSVAAYGGAIDHAMIAAPAGVVPELVADCAANGVASVSILSGGFAETGEAGRAIEESVAATARKAGMRVLGPNCLGFGNPTIGVCASPASVFESITLTAGPLGVLSQSGAIAADILVWARRADLGVGFWVSTGNEVDLSLADGIWHCVDDESISTLAIYLEGVRNVDQLEMSLRAANAAGKSVVLVRSGKTDAGVRAVNAHTGSLVTSARLYDALFDELGVAQVTSLREMVETARVATHIRPADTDGPSARHAESITIVSSSGGNGAMTVDAAVSAGATLSSLSESTRKKLLEMIPISSPVNPIDITGMTNERPELLEGYIGAILDDPGSGIVVFIHGAGMLWNDRGQVIAATFASLAERYGSDRIMMVATVRPSAAEILGKAGIPVFEDAVALVEAIGHLQVARVRVPSSRTPETGSPRSSPAHVEENALDEDQALDLLDHWGIPTVPRRLACSEGEAVDAAREVGLPVVAKLILPGVIHKTELGLVRVGLATESAVREAWKELSAVAADRGRAARVLIERQVSEVSGEFLVSAFSDPVLGPFVAVGAGGTLTELIDDVAFVRAPVDADQVLALVKQLRVGERLATHSSSGAADLGSIAHIVELVSGSLVSGESGLRPLMVEINPVLVTPEGACAVDAVVINGDANRDQAEAPVASGGQGWKTR